ncbi:Acetyltransferase (GNAT) family protein [Enhydrobacter aerosaccus]|uniref:Acetyltransferase (GNAT) family protein n=1 Tax=Enhydrobacter aerosaccus TaxID=225324 RepID=A0A1T4LTE3_9HYPH|nr:GNAT family N-acetyltransferase [Enhydrobacter aerosaccus]SJZ57886.1 Acetyltransferase (GNAT) family protein [Enhydrobacter aerosaccus]
MLTVRPYEPTDLDALYAISLATADAGGDASHLYRDKRLVGAIYSAPYAMLAPELVVVAADAEGVGGFVLGAVDTVAWQERLERSWWPLLRQRYPAPDPDARSQWTPDQRRMAMIHHPEHAPLEVVRHYPAHLHLNLAPRLQGRGLGTRLFHAWMQRAQEQGARATHVGVNRANVRGMAFWSRMGFLPVTPPDLSEGRTVWMGRD